MSDQGPTPAAEPTPPHGTPAVDDPTVATPPPTPPARGAGPGSTSVFGDAPDAAGDPTVAVPPVAGAAAGAAGAAGGPGGPGDPGGPGGPDDPDEPGEDGEDGEDGPWYTHPAAITAAALLGIGALVVILFVAFGGDDESGPTTTTTTSTTSTSTSTTVATTESRCRAGDQQACDEFSDEQLDVLCNEGVTAACQVLLARRGDGVPDQTTTIVVAPTDFQLCQQGDGPACSRLSDQDVSEICGQGVPAACDEQNSRFDDADYAVFIEECRNGVDAGCQKLTNEDLEILCDEGVGAACAERDSRSGE